MIQISVVIPVYQVIDYLDRALNSVKNQTCLPIEIIIVSDGNNLNLVNKINSIIAKFNTANVKLLQLEKNLGAGGARNAAWEIAKGDYVAFLDADDAWHPLKLQLQYEFMKDNPSISCSGHEYEYVESKDLKWKLIEKNIKFQLLQFPRMLFRNPFITPSVMIKTGIPFRFSKTQRYSEDYRLWLEISAARLTIAKIEHKLAVIFKPSLSSSGLSSNLIAMEIGELKAYWAVCNSSILKITLMFFLVPFSLLKFSRRILVRTRLKYKSLF